MPNPIGVCTGGSWLNGTDDDLFRDIDNMADTGFKWVRWDWQWLSIEWKANTFGAGLERRVMLADRIRKAGMNTLAVLGYTPSFYQQPGLGAMAPPQPQFYDEWGRYVEKCVEAGESVGVIRFGHWNESNHDPFWKYPSVKVQADMMRQSLAAAKRVNPNARFVLGEFAPGSTRKDSQGRELGINMVDYVDRWYKQGYKALAVGPWSIHPYMSSGEPDERKPWSTMTTQFDAIRAVLKANGHDNRKVWGTEFGYTTEPNDSGGRPRQTEAEQARLLTKQCAQWRTKPGAGVGFVFVWRDFPDHDGDGVNGLGVVRRDGSFKPSRAALKDLLT